MFDCLMSLLTRAWFQSRTPEQ